MKETHHGYVRIVSPTEEEWMKVAERNVDMVTVYRVDNAIDMRGCKQRRKSWDGIEVTKMGAVMVVISQGSRAFEEVARCY